MKWRLLERTGLPSTQVLSVIMGQPYVEKYRAALFECGIEVLSLPENPRLPGALAAHADLSLLHLGGERMLMENSLSCESKDFAEELSSRGVRIIKSTHDCGVIYPMDCILNICLIDNTVIGNPKTMDSALMSELTGKRVLKVRQGYAGCSTMVVDESAIITSDAGIASVARDAGISVLQISAGHIKLQGYDTGFIGGAAFKIARDRIAFTGSLDSHPDGAKIRSFLSSREVKVLELCSEPLYDVGKAIQLTEAAE